MEKGIEEDGGDDQGWHEVKKKRSSTKTSMKSNACEVIRKNSYDQSEINASNVIWHQSSLPSKGLRKSPADRKMERGNVVSFSGSFGSLPNEPDKEKVASIEIEVCKSLNSPTIVKRAQEEHAMYADKPLKIKWGDLEDENLAELYNTLEPLNISSESLSCLCPNEEKDGSIDERPSPNKEKDRTINDGLELLPVGVLSSESMQEKRVVTEVSIMDTDSVSTNARGRETSEKDAGRDPGTVCESCQTSCDKAEGNFISSKPCAEPCQGASASNQELAMPESSASQNAVPDDLMMANIESKKIPSNKIGGDKELSKCQVSSGFVEGEPGESKERFRERLWCFLFENLNRAVDELYLLCELECDIEQMTEAVLVLEEAGSDFRDLKSRIEGFDKQKGASAQLSQDDDLLNMKSDRRRPHALSWEVRRMTTSPRRAEILSTSLEAFKKIQQERASKQTIEDPRGSRPASILKSSSNQNQNMETNRLSKRASTHRCQFPPQRQSASDVISSHLVNKDSPFGKSGKGLQITKSEKTAVGSDSIKRLDVDTDKELGISGSFKSLNAWKEKRNWENVLSTPLRRSSRVSHSPGMSRRSMERARVIHEKLMSPENKKKKTALDMRREAEEKHARAMRIRNELENERMQKLQRASEKLNRVNEWQAVRSMKLREGMHARHQRSESRYEAHLAQVVRRAGDETSKVNEVRFITSLNEENKKFMYKQKLQDSELRRAEKLQVIRTKQKEDLAREEAVLERRKILEAEKLQKLAETQKKKEEALVRREEERKASSAAREVRAIEHQRRKEERARAQLEEAELLAQKLAERLSESESRRKFYLEQIRERASMDFRDQSSPSVRRSSNKENGGKFLPVSGIDDIQTNCSVGVATKVVGVSDATVQQSLKRRIKKIRQRLMALKHDIVEPPLSAEMAGIGYRTQVGAARAKIGRWLQDLQKLRQARKEGAANIGVIVDDMIKFLDGKDLELHMARQAGLLDFVASTLPASHTSKPEACQVTTHLLRLLRVVLSVPTNRSYFLSQNLLPPMIPMLSAALENYIKMAASSNASITSIVESNKATVDSSGPCAEVLEGLLCVVAMTIGHVCSEERQFQMQDGLADLIVAYQVVHRLHDLFALFDRPQLEGSPFPSSVLLSLNLLTVLISRSVLVSSINWDFYQSASSFSNKRLEPHSSADVEEVDDRNVSSEAKANSTSLLSSTTSDEQEDLNDQETETSAKMVRSGESFGDIAKSQGEEHSRSAKNGNNNVCDLLIPRSEACRNGDVSSNMKDENCQDVSLKPSVKLLFSSIRETGLVGVLSLLTAVLLQANSRNLSDQNSYVLPLNFEEVATGVLKVLNSMALVHIELLQGMLVRPDLKMEFFHLMSFLLSHCTNKWKSATDQVGLLLLETLLLLGYFSLLHPENQAVLRWGKSPTILHKVCDLPIVFFSDPELSSILAGMVIAACYGCEQNRDVIQQELSVDMVFSIIKSRRQKFGPRQTDSCSPERNLSADDSCEVNQSGSEPRKSKNEISVRSSRTNLRSSRVSLGKSTVTGTNGRGSKGKNQKESKGTKACDEIATKPAVTDSCFMWLQKFPSSFLDRAEKFFSAESTSS